MRRRAAFTLVELLVVIAVIVLLIALLLAALNRAKESARGVVCQSNQRQLATGFLLFAHDHKGFLPGNFHDRYNADAAKHCWLMGGGDAWFDNAPQRGTIFPYVRNLNVYRCPSLVDAQRGVAHSSNGRFDYAAFMIFSGASVGRIKTTSRFTYADGRVVWMPTPLLCDEDPGFGINTSNVEGGHANLDKMGHQHRGGAYYASIDASVHWFAEPIEQNCWAWTIQTGGEQWASLSHVVKWGWWNERGSRSW